MQRNSTSNTTSGSSNNEVVIGAQIGAVGTGLSYEASINPVTGEKFSGFSFSNRGVQVGFPAKSGSPVNYTIIPSHGVDFYRGVGGGLEITKESLTVKIGFGLAGRLPGDLTTITYVGIKTDIFHKIPGQVVNALDKAALAAIEGELESF
jgi:hypothetical protein